MSSDEASEAGSSTTGPVVTDSTTSSTTQDGGGTSSDPTAESSDSSTSSSESSTGRTDVACQDFIPTTGSPCNGEASCEFGDFCSSGLYECIDGSWAFRTTHGCGAEIVECEDGPEENNGCDTSETCDPDGDCLDVLECAGANWVAREVCNAIACPEANPVNGQPCDEPFWHCPLEHPCGVEREYQCTADGYWVVIREINEVCSEPVTCVEGPIPGDACALDAEACSFEAPILNPLTCIDGTWT